MEIGIAVFSVIKSARDTSEPEAVPAWARSSLGICTGDMEWPVQRNKNARQVVDAIPPR